MNNPIRRRLTVFFIGLPLYLFGASVYAGLKEDLNDGHHVLLIRHADAPGIGDPAGYKLDQCATQRNLGERGRKQSELIGAWLAKQGIDKAQVFTSPWCRCIDTAKLLKKGAITIEASLGSFFDDMSLEKTQTQALQTFIKNSLAKNSQTPLILVTHHVNIQAFTGKVVNVGDMVLVRVDKAGRYLSHTHYPSPQP
ncbi:histidine phosphatase family protein [Polynucleobacter sp. IMCC 29146]|uniref:histidine phosphatase family protein n=1 Tax=Polynucleobacter sp. IMCC 29146 TaxID=2780953 RepID=UPI001F25394C|nr:histidine phosphatase family protein [Polynucleobacter sp. IMCC 29146]MCE7530063.1 histidine phosphatase family protein [Polynucleobacter sp. IMCC 29146]